MQGNNPLVFERTVEDSEPDTGFREERLDGVGIWRNTAGLSLTASTTPKIATLTTIGTLLAIVWIATDGATAIATQSFKAPEWFKEKDPDILVRARARKVDSSTDENATLKLQATVSWLDPGSVTLQTLTTAATETLAASGTGAAGLFAEYVLDIGERLRAESKKIKPGAIVHVAVGPNTTVGSSDMVVEAMMNLEIRRHAAAVSRAKREYPN